LRPQRRHGFLAADRFYVRRYALNLSRHASQLLLGLILVSASAGAVLAQEATKKPFEPVPGLAGKDAVWVPSPLITVEKMLDVAGITPKDFVMDLGSGDGRNIIAAGKRKVNGLGVEWNQDLVDLSNQLAEKTGVAQYAKFVQGDMYAADISKASVLALFLLTENMNKMVPKFLAMRPGSRIVINGFGITGWTPDVTDRAEGDCGTWCTVHLFYVPANVAGMWQTAGGELTLKQSFQVLTGTLASGGKDLPIEKGKMRGDEISFVAGGVEYTGKVDGKTIQGTAKGSPWTATRK
jgi:hypothetical protein